MAAVGPLTEAGCFGFGLPPELEAKIFGLVGAAARWDAVGRSWHSMWERIRHSLFVVPEADRAAEMCLAAQKGRARRCMQLLWDPSGAALLARHQGFADTFEFYSRVNWRRIPPRDLEFIQPAPEDVFHLFPEEVALSLVLAAIQGRSPQLIEFFLAYAHRLARADRVWEKLLLYKFRSNSRIGFKFFGLARQNTPDALIKCAKYAAKSRDAGAVSELMQIDNYSWGTRHKLLYVAAQTGDAEFVARTLELASLDQDPDHGKLTWSTRPGSWSKNQRTVIKFDRSTTVKDLFLAHLPSDAT